MTVRLAVITTCYGHSQFLAESLESIARQTVAPAWHMLVADGDDEALNIMLDYAVQHPLRHIGVFGSAKRGGPAASWNAGFRNLPAGIDWCMKHDADDVALPSYLERVIASIQRDSEVDVVFTPLISRSYGDRCGYAFPHDCVYHFPEYSRERMLRECCIPSQAAVRASLFHQVGGADETMPAGEDWDLFVRLGLLTELRVRQLALPGWVYIDRGGHRVSDHVRKHIALYREYFAGHTVEFVTRRSRTWATYLSDRLLSGASAQ